MTDLKFYYCTHCGQIVIKVKEGAPMVCCGEVMRELIANTTDAASEKHVPVVSIKCNTATITVGSIPHPMTPDHYISHIIIETNLGYAVRTLSPNDEPKTTYKLNAGEKIKNVYAYCNLHSLWKN